LRGKLFVNRLEKYTQSICVCTLVQNVTGDGASCAVSFWSNRSPGRTTSMSPPDAEGPAKAKKPRVSCKYKDGLLISHGVPVPVDGVSVC
jgi:hypothetical protein